MNFFSRVQSVLDYFEIHAKNSTKKHFETNFIMSKFGVATTKTKQNKNIIIIIKGRSRSRKSFFNSDIVF